MSLDADVIWISGLAEIQLPGRTIRLCDGAFVDWAGNRFLSEDEEFGTIEAVDAISEAVSDEAPAGKLTMLPPSVVAASTLFQPSAQGSAMRFWMAEIDPTTGLVTGTPDLLFWGSLDTIDINIGRAKRSVDIEFTSAAERLFLISEGNVLSPRFHNLAWPGEKGFDHATGVPSLVPWGVPGPGRGTTGAGSTGGGSGGFLLGGGVSS